MAHVQVMDEILANKIAAGEVVEKTMNVVKELVENSIDAKSDTIKIELIDSGVKEIKVTDNGMGMDRNDAVLAFSRHATSKLKNLEDLFYIESLGFRGEAIPSIASVSEMTLKTSNGETGTIVTNDGGKIIDISNADLSKGTCITVKNLFYNTPVRLKYLKNLYIELANIVDYVNKMALSYPNIKFTLINNDKVLLKTDGTNRLLKVINDIYGLDVAKKMIQVSASDDDYDITGYISYPEVTKANRNSITILVNGRYIKNNELNKTIIDSYHTYIPVDKYPIIILNIDVDPILIDINIHPTKMDIKFSKMEELKELITNIIKSKLETKLLIPTIEAKETPIVIYKGQSKVYENGSFEEVLLSEDVRNIEEVSFDFEVKEDQDELVLNNETDQNRIKPMYPIGLVHGTYIIAENEDGMYMIDQHAAAERINYERYLKEMGETSNNSISILIPIKIELPTNEYIILKQHLDILTSFNFEIEEFGFNTLLIRRHPTWLPKGREEEAIHKIIDIITSKETFDHYKFIEKAAIMLSCKMAIKANDHISMDEMRTLLNNLRDCQNPFTCPHGRPTIITYTKYELEKLFKRAMN